MATIKGGDKLRTALRGLVQKATSAGKVRSGFLEGATYPDGTPVAMIAAIQNFGAPRVGIPPRPFFSNAVKDGKSHWGKDLAAAMVARDFDAKAALSDMGEEIVGEVRQAIIATNSPPLSPVTLLLRQRFWGNPEAITFADVMQARHDVAAGAAAKITPTQGKPLTWTGHLLNSADYEVT